LNKSKQGGKCVETVNAKNWKVLKEPSRFLRVFEGVLGCRTSSNKSLKDKMKHGEEKI